MSIETVKKTLRNVALAVLRPGPPKPGQIVEELLSSLCMMPKHLHQLYKVFHTLKQTGSESMELDATQISADSLLEIVNERKVWVERILMNLCQLAGCPEILDWDTFLYVTLRFASLSKVELAQCMFYVIVKAVKSWTVHFLTTQQIQEFYEFYALCPVDSFSTRNISFSKHLPLSRYYVPDFVELCHRFSQLINPAIHLQRSFQAVLPSVHFWNNYDRVEVYNRKITLDFFKLRKTHVFLRGVPPFRESCDMLLPDTLGAEPINEVQWDLRAPDYDKAQGVWPATAGRGPVVPGSVDDPSALARTGSTEALPTETTLPLPTGAPPATKDGIRPSGIPIGVGNEVRIPQSKDIGVEAVKTAMLGTLGASGNRPVDEGAPMGALPKWIRDFVTIPIRKDTTTRMQEAEFIASSRIVKTKAKTQVEMMMQANPRPLLEPLKKTRITAM